MEGKEEEEGEMGWVEKSTRLLTRDLEGDRLGWRGVRETRAKVSLAQPARTFDSALSAEPGERALCWWCATLPH